MVPHHCRAGHLGHGSVDADCADLHVTQPVTQRQAIGCVTLTKLSVLDTHLQAVDPILHLLCFVHDIRVMPDNSVMLPDGRRMPCEKAIRWLVL